MLRCETVGMEIGWLTHTEPQENSSEAVVSIWIGSLGFLSLRRRHVEVDHVDDRHRPADTLEFTSSFTGGLSFKLPWPAPPAR